MHILQVFAEGALVRKCVANLKTKLTVIVDWVTVHKKVTPLDQEISLKSLALNRCLYETLQIIREAFKFNLQEQIKS